MSFVIVSLLLSIAVGWALESIVRQVVSPKMVTTSPQAVMEDVCVDRYRPMLRLLDESEFDFLRAQPGCTRRMISKLRAQRCAIFRGYLRSLNDDFQRVRLALKLVMLASDGDRPELATILLRSQVVFASRMLAIHGRLFLFRWGLAGVDAAALLNVFDGLCFELRNLTPAAGSAHA